MEPIERLFIYICNSQGGIDLKPILTYIASSCLVIMALASPDGMAKESSAPTFASIKTIARDLALRPYFDDRRPLPPRLSELNYDQLRDIRYNPKESVWRRERLPFQLQFFHPGGLNRDQIGYYLVDGDDVNEFNYTRDLYDYGANKFDWADLRHLKFSGLRIHYPLNRPDYLDELAVFLGATYFRALPERHIYGLSARTIAVNCGEPMPEEFPSFRDMWIFRPGMDGKEILVLGLFDSPSLSGAASFLIKPGRETLMDTHVAVYARTNLAHYGIAPLTSMFWFGKNGTLHFDDYRPEVHDSDGLLLQTGKSEWLWRPLENNGRLRLNGFQDQNPKGFGLLQRERSFAAYQDTEANYHRRPSAWVSPQGDWGKGTVKLLEIPTGSEFHDNVVVFWEPERELKAGDMAEFAYQIKWFGDISNLPDTGRLMAMRTGAPLDKQNRTRKFVLDFSWPALAQDVAGGVAVEPQIDVARGRLGKGPISSEYNADTRLWRVAFDVIANDNESSVDLRAFIRKKGSACTETWTYLWMP